MTPDNRALWELVDEWSRIANSDNEEGSFAAGVALGHNVCVAELRSVLERPVVVGDDRIEVSRVDLLGLLDGNLQAASVALSYTGGIDFIEEHGGEESDEPMEQVAYHLYYTLHKAERLRAALESMVRGKS
ncbi:hypothetical protein ACN9MB_13330 [Dyella kyungheensis]|uniref:hypothetical protein n=1 Tax=Dyella kyungheensis TaxID=1242174 RepID=UPI003CEEFD5E